MARQIEPSTKLTSELREGDRVQLPGGIVRTVWEVRPLDMVNSKDEPLFAVMYREGGTPEWSEGNSGRAGSLWFLA